MRAKTKIYTFGVTAVVAAALIASPSLYAQAEETPSAAAQAVTPDDNTGGSQGVSIPDMCRPLAKNNSELCMDFRNKPQQEPLAARGGEWLDACKNVPLSKTDFWSKVRIVILDVGAACFAAEDVTFSEVNGEQIANIREGARTLFNTATVPAGYVYRAAEHIPRPTRPLQGPGPARGAWFWIVAISGAFLAFFIGA